METSPSANRGAAGLTFEVVSWCGALLWRGVRGRRLEVQGGGCRQLETRCVCVFTTVMLRAMITLCVCVCVCKERSLITG